MDKNEQYSRTYMCTSSHIATITASTMTITQGSYGYTYIRKPDPTDRLVYADKYVTHIELRPDVDIIVNDAKEQVSRGLQASHARL